MMTPHIMAFRQFRPPRFKARAVARPRALDCRVETLEPRLLLAASIGILHDIKPLLLTDYQVDYSPADAASLEAATTPVVEEAGPHSTLATAQILPLDTDTGVVGTLSASSPPALFRLPLDAANYPTLGIGLSWTEPNASVAGRLRILDGSGHVLVDEALSSQPLSLELELDPQDTGPSAALFIEIIPASGSARSAGFVLSVQPGASWPLTPVNTGDTTFAAGTAPSTNLSTNTTTTASTPAPQSQLASTSYSYGLVPLRGNDSSGSGLVSSSAPFTGSSSISGMGPAPGQVASSPASSLRVAPPLPQSFAQPVGGIFLTNEMLDAQIHEVAAVVADLSFVDFGPAVSSVTATVVTPSGITAPGSGARPALEVELWLNTTIGRRGEKATVPGCDASEPPCLVFGLPPAGVRAFDRSTTVPADARRELPRLALPELVDETVPAERPDLLPARQSATTEPTNGRRPRVAAALLYGSVCAMVGLVAPEWTQILRRAKRRLDRGGRRNPV